MSKQVLITVGTTQFNDLIKATDTPQFINLLKQKGYQKIIYQIGNGQYIPKHGQHFTLTPKVLQYYNKADLIITHGGAGTLLQNLLNGKIMIAVANTSLLGNHQVQLIYQLSKQGYVLGFNSVQDMQNQFDAIQKYLEHGPPKKYTKPQNCIMNSIIFDKQKSS